MDEFPTLKLPVLPTSATVPVKQRSPRERCETQAEDEETSEESVSSDDKRLKL